MGALASSMQSSRGKVSFALETAAEAVAVTTPLESSTRYVAASETVEGVGGDIVRPLGGCAALAAEGEASPCTRGIASLARGLGASSVTLDVQKSPVHRI